jgi:hypothetical protein
MRILRGGGINLTRKRVPMAEEKPQESVYDRVRREARERQEQERERRARLAEIKREGGSNGKTY